MRINVDIGDELAWLREGLEQVIERGLAEVKGGGRPEYAAGYYAASMDLADDLEARYQNFIAEERAKWKNQAKAK